MSYEEIDTGNINIDLDRLKMIGEAISITANNQYLPTSVSENKLVRLLPCSLASDELITWILEDKEKRRDFLYELAIDISRIGKETARCFIFRHSEIEKNWGNKSLEEDITSLFSNIHAGRLPTIASSTYELAKKVSNLKEDKLTNNEIKDWAEKISKQISNAND